MSDDQIVLVPIEQIDRPVNISRELIDPERVRELAESIRDNGLLQPILLRPKDGRYETIAGDRRYLAHKLLGLKVIKAIVKECSESEMQILRGIENLQRENLTQSEQGLLYILLHDKSGLTFEQVAQKVGKKKGTIERYVRFARLPVELRRPVDAKKLSIESLSILMEIEDSEIFRMYFESASQNGITEKVARMWVDQANDTIAGRAYAEGGGCSPSSIEVEAKPVFMTCEICNGPCEIHRIRSIVACPECGEKVRRSQIAKPGV